MAERIVTFLSGEGVIVTGLAIAVALAVFGFLGGGQASDRLRLRGIAGSVAGTLLVVGGAYVAARFGAAWAIPCFAAGYGLLWWLVRSLSRHRHEIDGVQRILWFDETLLNGSLLAGVLLVGNIVAMRYGGRPVDLSRDGSYSLETLTQAQLASLSSPVTFTVLFGGSEEAAGQLERVRQLMRLFQAQNPPKVHVEYFDLYSDPSRTQELSKDVPGLQEARSGGVIVAQGEGRDARRILVRNAEMFAVSADRNADGGEVRTQFLGEPALTTALIQLTRGARSRVGITTGHGEPSIDETDANRRGIGALRIRLESVGMEVVPVNPSRDLPSDLSALIVAAPEVALEPDAIGRIRSHAEHGGHVIVWLDGRTPTGLEDWLQSLGITLGPGVVVDPTTFVQQPTLPLIEIDPGRGAPSIVSGLAGRMVLMPNASPLDIRAGAQSPQGLVVTPLLRTGVNSWAETDPKAATLARDPERDPAGPLFVGAAVAERPRTNPADPPRPMLVAFSTRFLADNWAVARNPTNLDLMVNALGWLERRPDLSGVSPRTYVARTLTAGPNLRAKLVLLPTFMSIAALLGAGMAIRIARRD